MRTRRRRSQLRSDRHRGRSVRGCHPSRRHRRRGRWRRPGRAGRRRSRPNISRCRRRGAHMCGCRPRRSRWRCARTEVDRGEVVAHLICAVAAVVEVAVAELPDVVVTPALDGAGVEHRARVRTRRPRSRWRSDRYRGRPVRGCRPSHRQHRTRVESTGTDHRRGTRPLPGIAPSGSACDTAAGALAATSITADNNTTLTAVEPIRPHRPVTPGATSTALTPSSSCLAKVPVKEVWHPVGACEPGDRGRWAATATSPDLVVDRTPCAR